MQIMWRFFTHLVYKPHPSLLMKNREKKKCGLYTGIYSNKKQAVFHQLKVTFSLYCISQKRETYLTGQDQVILKNFFLKMLAHAFFAVLYQEWSTNNTQSEEAFIY